MSKGSFQRIGQKLLQGLIKNLFHCFHCLHNVCLTRFYLYYRPVTPQSSQSLSFLNGNFFCGYPVLTPAMYNKCYVCGDRSEVCRLTCFLVFRYNTTLPTKIPRVKATFFPVVMYGCEGQTIKKAEHRGINAFELWCWRRLLRDLWMAIRSNQSILKEINPEYSLEGLMLKPEAPIPWPPDVKERTHQKTP